VGCSPFLRSYSHIIQTQITISVPFDSRPTQISIDQSYIMTFALDFALIMFYSVACHSKTIAHMHSIFVPSRLSSSHVHCSSFTSAYSLSFSYCSSPFNFNFYIACHMLCHLKRLRPSMRTYLRRTSLTFLTSHFISLICLELF
jgi:predicted metal-dependent hydrolase